MTHQEALAIVENTESEEEVTSILNAFKKEHGVRAAIILALCIARKAVEKLTANTEAK